MASRTRQKEEAKARRLAEEQARQGRARRDRRLRILGGVVLVAVAVVAVAIAISAGSSGGGGLQKGTKATATETQVDTLLAGIPQSGATLGNPSAPVTLTYFGDLECPVCQAFTLSSFPQLITNEVRAGKVKVVYKAFETATRDPTVFGTQQVAALAAGEQNKFWQFAELFYHEQGQEDTGYVTESYLDGLARQIPGLNYAAWKSARSSATLAADVQADINAGTSAGVQGTPTLIFSGPHGQAQPNEAVPQYSELQQDVQKVE